MSAPKTMAGKPLRIGTRSDIEQMGMSDAKRLLRRLSDCGHRGTAPDAADMQKHAASIDRILEGEDPTKALGLSKRARGRPRKTDEHSRIAQDVADQFVSLGDLDKALKVVASTRKMKRTTVRTAYYDHRPGTLESAEALRQFLRDQAVFRKAYKELESELGHVERDRIFGELPARVAVAVARQLKTASFSEYHDLVEEIRGFSSTKPRKARVTKSSQTVVKGRAGK